MGAHSHSSRLDIPSSGRGVRATLLGFLALVAVAVGIGLVVLWPDSAKVDEVKASQSFAAPGVTFPKADVISAQPACADPMAGGTDCDNIVVEVTEGKDAGTQATVQVPPEVAKSGLVAGDRVVLQRIPEDDSGPASFVYYAVDRGPSLLLLTAIFALVVVAVAWLRGLLALVGLGFAGGMVLVFMLPALLTGEPAPLVAFVGAAAIMYVVLYLAHGVSLRTSVALAGTLVGLAVTAGLGVWAVGQSRLTGIADEGGGVLTTVAGNLDFPGLLACSIVLAGLGVLNDVTITQASSVWELRAAAPSMPRWRVWASAMRIGRDHIASTIYTIVFAYVGAGLSLLLILSLFDQPMLALVGTEEIAEEIVRSLVSVIGLVLAVPVTTAIAVLVAGRDVVRAGGPGDPLG
ncbi:YibE/F family protein [Nocardioides sp.]|uniref:YibE/F family protein n=1 Tax=Nocardioides sp. TaxID=35761 RepID=UPI0039E6F0E4